LENPEKRKERARFGQGILTEKDYKAKLEEPVRRMGTGRCGGAWSFEESL